MVAQKARIPWGVPLGTSSLLSILDTFWEFFWGL